MSKFVRIPEGSSFRGRTVSYGNNHYSPVPEEYNSFFREFDSFVSMKKMEKAEEEKRKKAEEIKANIPKRALMLEEISYDISSLPELSTVLWKEIAEYEGGVESSLLGQSQNDTWDTWPCCSIL